MQPERFATWAKEYLTESALLSFPTSDGAVQEFYQCVGHLREYGNTTAHYGTCEFWMPIGWIDGIIRKHLGSQFVADRAFLVNQLLRTMRVSKGMLQDEYAFQVLQVELDGQNRFFWRANQPYGKFQHWLTAEAHAQRQQRRQEWYARHQALAAQQPVRDIRVAHAAGQLQQGGRLPTPPPAPPRGDAQQWWGSPSTDHQRPEPAWASPTWQDNRRW